jgi:hypothetical protein
MTVTVGEVVTNWRMGAMLIRDGWVLCGSSPNYFMNHPTLPGVKYVWVNAAEALFRHLKLKPDVTATEYPRWVLP